VVSSPSLQSVGIRFDSLQCWACSLACYPLRSSKLLSVYTGLMNPRLWIELQRFSAFDMRYKFSLKLFFVALLIACFKSILFCLVPTSMPPCALCAACLAVLKSRLNIVVYYFAVWLFTAVNEEHYAYSHRSNACRVQP